MFTVRTRVILASLLATAAVLTVLSFVVYENYRTAVMTAFDERIAGYAERLQTEVEEQQAEHVLFNAEDIKNVSTEGLVRPAIRIVDTAGAALVADPLLQDLPVPPWTLVLARKRIMEDRRLDSRRCRSLWVPLEVNDSYRYALQIVAPTDDVERDLERIRNAFFWAIPLALMLAAVAAHMLIGRAFRPLTQMIETVRSITPRDLGKRLPLPRGNDEVHVLAATLNGLMERVDEALAAQKQFIADASHEIRTPLAIIQSELEFVARQVKDDPAHTRIGAALDEVDRLKLLTDDLLLLARLDAPGAGLPKRPVRLDEVVTDCVRRLTPIARAHGNALELLVETAIEVQGDEERLRSVFLNLIENAVKYSKSGSAVEISLASEGPRARVSVRDRGPGIPAEEIPELFKRFRRGERARESGAGSGLGLAIAQRIVELHEGTITVVSEVGTGSIFTVDLPTGAP